MVDANKYDEAKLFPQIIAVDFDGTLVENKFPEIGAINPIIWDAVKEYQKAGYKIILWTCRTKEMLQDAIDFCTEHGLKFDAVNQNIPEVQAYYGEDTRKVFANMYLDDRSAAMYIPDYGVIEFNPVPLINVEVDMSYGS